MGLTISAVEIPLLTVYATVLAFLQLFRPRKSLTGKINHPEEAAGIWDEEWDLDSVATGKSYIIEGSNSSGQSIYIELVTHDTYNSATIVLGDAMRTIGGQFSGAIVDNRTIKCGPLFVEMREPFRRWRITFKGYLENDQERNFVSLAGWWKPTADARFFYSDLTASSLRFSKNFDFQSNIEYLSKAHFSDHLSQFGQYHAEVTIDGISSELRFRGIRQFGSYKNIQAADEFHAYLEDGNRVSYRSVTCEGHSVTINHGYVDKANRQCTSVSLPDESVLSTDNNRLIEFKPAHCSTLLGVLPFPLRKGEICSTYSYFSSTGHEVKLKRVKVNHALSTGFALLRTVRESLKEVEHPQFHSFEDVTATDAAKQRKVVPFSLRSCQDKEFTGGKGANLAKLKSMEHKYVVPNGAVITTTAFNSFLEANSDIKKLVQVLSAKGLSVEEYVLQGELIHEAIMKASPPSELHLLLEEAGIVSDNKIKYAVRSSAVGEDGSDLSSAGQLESVLNVPFDDIPAKVLECWCSNFRREVISYRRNYGQELNPSMAVVVQEMITDGCAGVMFTCDPVKNNDSRLVINAIRGCGEDIVSGVVTPDEIIVEKKTLQMSKPDNCCLDDDSLHNLVNVGLFLEGIFGTAQDVEFVMKGTKVFLVQSRDVTGRDRESRFELLSEFDNATLTDKEIFTTANVGEVVPAPMSPLEISQTSGLYDSTMANMILKDLPGTHLTRHNNTTFHTYGQRMLLNIGEMFLRQHSVMKNDRLAEISIAGCHIFTEEMFKQAEVRYGPVPKLFPLKRLQVIGHMMFIRSYRIMDEIHAELKKSEQLTPTGEITFESLLETLNKQLLLYRTILEMHSGASVFSSFTHIVVGMLIRGSPEGDTTPDMLSDLARIFSNSSTTVISADVPAALEKLAKAIKEDGLQQEFLAAADNEAVNLLKTKGRLSAEQIDDFLKVHGHRGPKELYIRSDGWAEKPELLVVTLKTMLSSKMEEKPANNTTIDELLDSLKCQPKGFKRQMMKYMVKESHRGVASRELAKSCLVKSVYECRKTSKMIAKMLYENGLIPDEDLYFFLHLDEVKTLWKTRSAKLIARAMRRRQIFPEFEERRYAHVYYGNPEPLNLKTADDSATEVSLTGTVVCEGKVVAKARVAVNLEEAKHTQSGEILITRCTDICWSPFFPIIKGIVTEIGGLLSHGAVVAREYGLPSLIAVENATAVFRTGDLVELDTHKGTISKITMFSS